MWNCRYATFGEWNKCKREGESLQLQKVNLFCDFSSFSLYLSLSIYIFYVYMCVYIFLMVVMCYIPISFSPSNFNDTIAIWALLLIVNKRLDTKSISLAAFNMKTQCYDTIGFCLRHKIPFIWSLNSHKLIQKCTHRHTHTYTPHTFIVHKCNSCTSLEYLLRQ